MTHERAIPGTWREPFLEALRVVPVISRAAKRAGIHRSRIQQVMKEDPEFAEAVKDAIETGVERAEAEAFRRAVKGVEKGVWHQGVKVGTERVYSDTLLLAILKGHKKSVYAERTELTGANGGPLVDGKEMDDTAKAARVAALMSLAAARKMIEDLC